MVATLHHDQSPRCSACDGAEVVHPMEGAATADAPAAAPSFAALLTGQLLRDGELVILILRPSLWFVPLSSLRFIVAVVVAVALMQLLTQHLPPVNPLIWIEIAIFLIAGRLMWAITQWTSNLYVLTDLRIARISGVFNVSIFECPLRKVARVRIVSPLRERLVGVGSLEIIPTDDSLPSAVWHTVARPRDVHQTILDTIRRAGQGSR